MPEFAAIWEKQGTKTYFTRYSDLYVRGGNPFFIPEINFDSSTAIKAFAAFGKYRSMGFSPFAVETNGPANNHALSNTYAMMKSLEPFLFNNKGVDGFLVDKATKQKTKVGNYKLTIAHDNTLGWNRESKDSVWAFGGGIIIVLSDDEFLIGGNGIVVTAASLSAGRTAGILEADEGMVVNGKWVTTRRLNGDQTHQGRHIRLPLNHWGLQRVKLYTYEQ
jgi:hypothetical protein